MRNQNKTWFTMKAEEDKAEITIFDEIGMWGVTAGDFKRMLDEVKDKKEILVLLNSVGGNVFDGMAIYNMLLSLKDKIDIVAIGLAASIVSIIAQAGRTFKMARGSYYMIHKPSAITSGTSIELRKTADTMDKIESGMIQIYKDKSGLSDEELSKMLLEERWFSAEEAVQFGFADSIEEYGDIAACVNKDIVNKYGFNHVPEAIAIVDEDEHKPTTREVEKFLRDAEYSRRDAEAIAAKKYQVIDRGDPEPNIQGEPEKIDMTAEIELREREIEINRRRLAI